MKPTEHDRPETAPALSAAPRPAPTAPDDPRVV
jgi:hypothetical protein